jgi:hypothetical protein
MGSFDTPSGGNFPADFTVEVFDTTAGFNRMNAYFLFGCSIAFPNPVDFFHWIDFVWETHPAVIGWIRLDGLTGFTDTFSFS